MSPTTSEPSAPRRRASDSERERTVQRLNQAFTEGRLTKEELDERLTSAYRATFEDELATLLGDLPTPDEELHTSETIELSTGSGTLKRGGDWVVPRRLRIQSGSGTVRLDLTGATIEHRVVDIELTVESGTTIITLAHGSSADVDGVTTRHGTVRSRVSARPNPAGLHVRLSGRTETGTVKVRYGRHHR